MPSLQDWLRYVDSQRDPSKKKAQEEQPKAPEPERRPTEPAPTPRATARAVVSWAHTAPAPVHEPPADGQAEATATAAAPPEPAASATLANLTPGKQLQPAEEPAPQEADAKRAPRKRQYALPTRPRSAHPAADAQAWQKVPRQLQLLLNSTTDEVAARSYKPFRESREQLIRRLLDPELSLEDAARILGVCPTTVRRYTNKGYLPHYRTVGNQRRFRLSDILEFMEKRGVLPADVAEDQS